MQRNQYSSLSLARVVALALWLPLCGAAVLAPAVALGGNPAVSAVLYAALSPVCHQLPGRSFTIQGLPWAACHRCSGLYLGLAAAALAPASFFSAVHRRRRLWAGAGIAPALVDFSLTYFGIWENTALSRFGSGLAIGLVLSVFVVSGIAELAARRAVRDAPPGLPAFGDY